MKKGFIIYKSLYEPIKALDREQKGELLEAIFEYQTNSIIIENISPIVTMAFMFFKNQFDIDQKKYEEKCAKAKESIEKRWNKKDTKVYERIESNTNDTDKREKKEDKSKKVKEESNKKEDIDFIYSLYPTKCPVKNNSTCKSIKCKDKIKDLLKSKTREKLENTINNYLVDCKNSKTWLKNFKTFLNDLPDYPDNYKVETKQNKVKFASPII